MENVARDGFFRWLLRFYAFGLCCVIGLILLAGLGTYIYFAATVPTLPEIDAYDEMAAATSFMRAWDGTPIAELAAERREILPFDKLPPRLVHAFLAAEDRRFYEHHGLDYRGIARAIGANLRAGEVAQGGSTITQQVAKSFLTNERTIERKIREAILARRIEAHFSKREILTLYLNQVFLGHGTFGVGAAARRYFDKAVGDLDLGEMATLAGLVRAPSRFSPLTDIEAARARRDQVLTAMVAAGYATDEEANRWRARPVIVRQRPDYFRTISPYFAEQVRRDVLHRYGEKKLYEGGSRSRPPWSPGSTSPPRRTSTSRCASSTSGRGGGVRSRACRARRPTSSGARVAARYGADPPVEGRLYLGLVESTAGAGPPTCASGPASTPCLPRA